MRTVSVLVLILLAPWVYGQKAVINNPESSEDRVVAVTGAGLEQLSTKEPIELAPGRYTGTMECLVAGQRYVKPLDFTVGQGKDSVWVFSPSQVCAPMIVTLNR